MSLDVAATAAQVSTMAQQLAAHAARMKPVPDFARALLAQWHASHAEAVAYLEGQEQAGVWPFAIPIEPMLTVRRVPAEPVAYAVVAADGSQIDVDSHGLVHCCLVNVGWAAIAYGDRPDAWLANEPAVLHEDRELFVEADDGMREASESQLSMLRTVAEMERLALVAEAWRDRPGLVAIADGNLVRWELGGKKPSASSAALLHRYLGALAQLRAARIPVCGYISRPNARDVANTAALLAVRDCDRGKRAVCDRCAGRGDRLCESLRVLPDRDLFPHVRVGECTGLFRTPATVLQHYAPDDRIVFCYLRTAEEMARIELPAWCTGKQELNAILSAVYGQCLRGHGYPVALMEAHEQAVIHTGGREAFRQLVLAALNENQLEAAISSKRLSKDQRAV